MIIVLTSYKIKGFVCRLLCPIKINKDETYNGNFRYYVRQDQMIASQLISSMIQDFINKVFDCETSYQIWTVL